MYENGLINYLNVTITHLAIQYNSRVTKNVNKYRLYVQAMDRVV